MAGNLRGRNVEVVTKLLIENLKHNKMLDLLGQAWQSGSVLAAQTHGRAAVNKHCLCGPLLAFEGKLQYYLSFEVYYRIEMICKSMCSDDIGR